MAVEGSKDVLYFTHDYNAQTSDKNDFLVATSKLGKRLGVDKLIAVTPVENDLYYTEEHEDLIDIRNGTVTKALSENKNLSILSPNPVFGGHTYFVRYLEQLAAKGSAPEALVKAGSVYYPVHSADLASAIQNAFNNFNEAKGNHF